MPNKNDLNAEDRYIHPESRPNAIIASLAGLQHIGICLVTLAYPRLVGETAGLSQSELANYMQLSFLALGVSTLFHTIRTPIIGTGLLIPSCFTLLYVPGALFAAKIGGIGAVAAMTISAGIIEIILSRFVRNLRVVLPPDLVGIVIFMIGISLSLFAFGQMTHKDSTLQEMLISFMSLLVIIAVSIWGKRDFVIFATLIGMLLGALISFIFDITTTAGELEVPELAILYWPMAMPSFSIGLVPGILTGTIGCLVRCTGDIVASAQMTDQKWKRPDYSQISRGVMADGLGSLFAGLIGVIGTNTYSGSVGLVAASRVASRRIGFFIAAGWIFLAVMPNSALLVIWIPKGIFGATLFFVALFVIRSGINLLGQRLFDMRKTILIGSTLALGLSYDNINLKDAFVRAHFPEAVSAILLILISGILLNLFFRIGIKKTREQNFIVDVSSDKINQFLLECGQAWSARSEAIFRASAVGEEVNEYLNQLENPPKELHMKVSFDELTINIEFRWTGLSRQMIPSDIPVNENLDITLISMRLMRYHSDKLRVRKDVSGECYLQVQIDDH